MNDQGLALLENEGTNSSPSANFDTQNETPKNAVVGELIRFIVKRTRSHHLDYDSLRYVFRRVRELCEVEVPRKAKRLFELPTSGELEAFYGVMKDPTHKLIFKTLEGTGLRISEFVSLRIDRVHFDKNQMFIKEGKGKKDRIVLFGNRLKEMLLLHLNGRTKGWLFESSWNYKFTTRRIEQLCERYRKEAKIEKKITPHVFRHCHMTFLSEKKIPQEQREILAGHSPNSDVQRQYTHLTLASFKDEVIRILDEKA